MVDQPVQEWVTVDVAAKATQYHPNYLKIIAREGRVMTRGGGVRGKKVEFHLESLLAYVYKGQPPPDRAPKSFQPSSANSADEGDFDGSLDLFSPSSEVITDGIDAEDSPLPSCKYIVTDHLPLITCLPLPEVVVVKPVSLDSVRQLIQTRSKKVCQYFHDANNAEFIARHLELKRDKNARLPQLSNGDSIIVATVQTGQLGPHLVCYLFQTPG